MSKTALIIGATGLVGSCLLQQIIADEDFSKVKVFVRRSTGIKHKKLEEIIIDFEEIVKYKEQINADVLFSCLGTTIKQAGSKKNQYRIDYTYQYDFAKLASENRVKNYFLISSTSAHPKSMMFYSRIKGELEEAIKTLNFEQISIFQPSVLAGERENKRKTEEFAASMMNRIGKIIPSLNKYRSIEGRIVAKAMINIFKKDRPEKIKTYKLEEIFEAS